MKKSERFLLRLPTDLRERVEAFSKRRAQSINSSLVELVASGLNSTSQNEPVQQVKTIAERLYGDRLLGLVLFGSCARGDTHTNSDIDLLVVVDDSQRIVRDMYREWDRLQLNGASVHLCHLPAEIGDPGSLWLECALDGIIVFDRRGDIARTLRALTEQIASGSFTRRTTHGQGYWSRGGVDL